MAIRIDVPKKKIETQTKSVIKTVIERCKKEKDSNCLQLPLDKYEDRVSYYTGFPKPLIYRLCDDSDMFDKTEPTVESVDASMFSECMYNFYLNREFPTYRDVFNKLKTHIPQFAQFRQIMIQLGYNYRKTTDGHLLMEDPKLVFERFLYIKNIRRLRELKKTIYYIDERVIDAQLSFRKPEIHNNVYSGMILIFAITNSGYETGFFCYLPNQQELSKWIIDILVPTMEPSSVVVIDHNSPLCGSLASISRYHKKSDMLQWLTFNGIPCNDNMRKAELYELIDKSSNVKEDHALDQILKAHGHEILYLPLHYTVLSQTNFLLEHVKCTIGTPSTGMLSTAYPALKEAINRVIASVPKYMWQKFERTVLHHENKIFNIDTKIEILLDKYNIIDFNETCYESRKLLEFDFE